MCGIVGAIGSREIVSRDVVGAMVGTLAHRGPDDRGIHSIVRGNSVVWLCNTRLAVLDLTDAGHQPMQDPMTSNWIAYNGEVYNFREMRSELESCGIQFGSETDTEVVLKAYAQFGPTFISRLRGMFAIAIWDASRQEMFLCRDRLGLKPLYYAQLPAGLLFASELRTLLESGLIERRLDPATLEAFLANGFVVSPNTMILGIRSLLPGTWMRIRLDGRIAETSRYWKLTTLGTKHSSTELISETQKHLTEAVGLRMVSDVPLGAFLSGGMDSSTVVAMMKRTGADVRTFAVTFEEAAYDESSYSRWVAKRFGTKHTELRLQRQAFYAMVPAALATMDQPTYDGMNTYCVSRAARESGLKVALSGLGADELFGGYGFFNSAYWLAQTKPAVWLLQHIFPHTATRGLERSRLNALEGFWKAANLFVANRDGAANPSFLLAAYQTTQLLFPLWARRALLSPDLAIDDIEPVLGLPKEFVKFLAQEIERETDIASVFSNLALRLFLGERCLRDTDAMSMSVSLEVRAPFTDHLLVEGLLQFAGVVRFVGAPDKPLLRRIADPFLGEDYPRRRKQGFIFPFREWLASWEDFCEFISSQTMSKSLVDIGFNAVGVAELFGRFRRNPAATPWSRVWAVFVVAEWCRRHRVRI